MITVQLESMTNVKKDIKPLLNEHWELVALNQGKIKLNPDYEEYARLDAAGVLKCFTARNNGALVGYFILLISNSIHYSDHLFAVNDVIFVKPDSRAGATVYKLIKYAEDYCEKMGVSVLTLNTKVHLPFDKLMVHMGFNLIERIYSKYLGK